MDKLADMETIYKELLPNAIHEIEKALQGLKECKTILHKIKVDELTKPITLTIAGLPSTRIIFSQISQIIMSHLSFYYEMYYVLFKENIGAEVHQILVSHPYYSNGNIVKEDVLDKKYINQHILDESKIVLEKIIKLIEKIINKFKNELQHPTAKLTTLEVQGIIEQMKFLKTAKVMNKIAHYIMDNKI